MPIFYLMTEPGGIAGIAGVTINRTLSNVFLRAN